MDIEITLEKNYKNAKNIYKQQYNEWKNKQEKRNWKFSRVVTWQF